MNIKAILAGSCVVLMGSAAQATVIYSRADVGTHRTQHVDANTLSGEGAHDYVGLYWASIDSYNYLSFYLGKLLGDTFSSDDLAPLLANGDRNSWLFNRYVNFYFHGDAFDRVVVTSTGRAFESGNQAVRRRARYNAETVSVPEPGTLALLAAGLLGFGIRRRRTS